ncbi:sterol desaturase family protein [Gammaproteobacteria bacterium LSUCC0112]|nr:sterol desaturase family protein [Gammaproteobacteria bacterium LSUCC0112]
MDLILAAVPIFILLIFVELAVSQYKKAGVYRLNDAVASMSTGMISQTMGFATRFVSFLGYTALWTILPHGELTMSPLIWVVAFVLYDFCYYWNHRAQHSINVLWGIHVVHHQSEEYNLTTALRQPFNGFIIGSVFYLPMLFIGFPPEVIVTVGSLNLIYQYWVHTRLIGTLGWMEQVFVTPMNHRVHHAINDPYIDRNFGGVFILWDRLLGTYQAELAEEPCAYGVRKALHSWNPFFANAQVHWQLLKDSWHAERWWDKVRVWFMPTGWRPADVTERYPLPRCLPDTQQKYNPPIPGALKVAVLAIHVFLVLVMVSFQLMVPVDNFTQALVHFIPLGAGLWLNGRLLEGRPDAVLHSSLFWGVCALLPWWYDAWLMPPVLSTVGFLVASGVILISARQQAAEQSDVVSSNPESP